MKQIVNLQAYRSLLRELWENIFIVIIAILSIFLGFGCYDSTQWDFPEKDDLKQEYGVVSEVTKGYIRGIVELYNVELNDGRQCWTRAGVLNYLERTSDFEEIKQGDEVSFLRKLDDNEDSQVYTFYVNNKKIFSYEERYQFEVRDYKSLFNHLSRIAGLGLGGIGVVLIWGSVNDPWDNGIKTLHGKRRKIKKRSVSGQLKFKEEGNKISIYNIKEVIYRMYLEEQDIQNILKLLPKTKRYFEYYDEYFWKRGKGREKTHIIRPKKYLSFGKKIYFWKINLLENFKDSDELQERYIIGTNHLKKICKHVNAKIRNTRTHMYEEIVEEMQKSASVHIVMTLDKQLIIHIKNDEVKKKFLEELKKIAVEDY